jgi:hypothetical protein
MDPGLTRQRGTVEVKKTGKMSTSRTVLIIHVLQVDYTKFTIAPENVPRFQVEMHVTSVVYTLHVRSDDDSEKLNL